MNRNVETRFCLDRKLLTQLRCPECGGPLETGDEGSLRCLDCRAAHAVVGGIPRFVQQEHLASFGLQWNRYDVARDEEDQATFCAKTGMQLDELDGLRVLDAGCGGGRYSKIAGEARADVIAVDHTAAVDKAAGVCGHLPNVHFLQADLKQLPLEQASFDFAFSIGVLHHDVDTRTVFDAVARMVRPGGRLAVWLYRRNQWWQEAINSALRRRTVRMPAERLERFCRLGATLGGVPLVRSTLNKLVNFSSHPQWENRVCDTFDWYAPEYQHHHTLEELCIWFREAGYDELIVLPPERKGRLYRWAYEHDLIIGSGVNVLGTRRPAAESHS